MKRGLAAILILVLVCGLILGACTTNSSSTPSTSTPSPQASSPSASPGTPQRGGTLRIIYNASPTQFGWTPSITAGDVPPAWPAFEGLTFADKNAQPTPWLATSWEVDPNGKYIIFHLRQSVKFQDGTDFNAQAAKYNLDLALQQRPGDLTGVTSVDVIDDYTIRMNMTGYNNMLFADLGTKSLMGSPTYMQSAEQDVAKFHPVGTGPFKFVSWQQDVNIQYTRFDGYWDTGKPYLDGLEYIFITDPMTAAAAFQKGEADMMQNVNLLNASNLVAAGYSSSSCVGGVVGLAPDTKNANSIFANKNVREALEYAINRDEIVKQLGYGFLEDRTQFSPASAAGYDSSLTPRQYDPQKAKQLLSDAGYPNGFSTTIYASTQFSIPDVMVAIQSDLAAVGINANLDYCDPGRYASLRRQNGWTDGLMFMYNGGFPSVVNIMNFILSQQRNDYVSMQRPAGGEQLLQQMIAEPDPAKVTSDVKQMVDLLYNNATFVPLYAQDGIGIMQNYVHDTGFYSFNHLIENTPANAWMSK
jgi:ABC-type transport system substrate-binding protein